MSVVATPARSRLKAFLDERVFFTGTPPLYQAAFEAHARSRTNRNAVLAMLVIAAGILLLWPTDYLITFDEPGTFEALQRWRLFTLPSTLLVAGLLEVSARRGYTLQFPLLLFGFGVLPALSASVVAHMGGLDRPFIYSSYLFLGMFILFLMPIGRRVLFMAAVTVAFFASYFFSRPTALADSRAPSVLFTVAGGWVGYLVVGHMFYALTRRSFMQGLALEDAQARTDGLLLNILPASIADRLKGEERFISEGIPEATVLFADVVGFTPLSDSLAPAEVVHFLNDLFITFDTIAERHGVEKIKTIGDAYMAAAGVPVPRPDHAEAIARMALEMVAFAEGLKDPNGKPVRLRIGVHSGPVVAGVIGLKKFAYDLWGDTVNTASRMESHGEAGAIHVSAAAAERLGEFTLKDRGLIQVKGKGEMRTFFLEGKGRG